MTKLERQKQYHTIQLKIQNLKYQQLLIDEIIQSITEHLAGAGHTRRIKPCDIDNENEKDCPWTTK